MNLAIFNLRYCVLTFTLISILNSYNNGGYLKSRPRLFQLLNLLISNNFKSHASLIFEEAQAKAQMSYKNNKNDFPLDVVQCCLLFPAQLPTGTPLQYSVLILSMARINQMSRILLRIV